MACEPRSQILPINAFETTQQRTINEDTTGDSDGEVDAGPNPP
jgi:hypothetical protein